MFRLYRLRDLPAARDKKRSFDEVSSFLPWRIHCPRRDGADQARVSDLLTEVLRDVLNDVEQDAAFGDLPVVRREGQRLVVQNGGAQSQAVLCGSS
jgi:hypothetical protein